MEKHVYMTKDELRNMEICMCNDYIGNIKETRWVNYLDAYEVIIEFESKEELKQFCDMYGYKTSRIGDKGLLKKIEG